MTYPEDFLKDLAKRKKLSTGQTEVFLALFGQGLSRDQITQQLGKPHALRGRLTPLYDKFGFGDETGPVQEKRLKDLIEDYWLRWKPKYLQNLEAETEVIDELNALVRKVRLQGKDRIIAKIGRMKMLRVRELVPIDDIYVDLNLLKRPNRDTPFVEQRDQLQSNKYEFRQQFDRIGRSRPEKEHIPVLDVLRDNNNKLMMVLGKPGSGKTTLLKSLTVKCANGELDWAQKSYIPIFITLKTFADDFRHSLQNWERTKPLVILQAIQQELKLWKITDKPLIEKLATEGRFWLLLDGLDEVSGEEGKAVVLQQIRCFYDCYSNNRITLTCRTQQQKYRFDESLVDVEIADFTPAKVKKFVDHWFNVVLGHEHQTLAKQNAEKLFTQLQEPENKAIAELAVTPILLNLICVYAERSEGKLPKNRASLYEKSIRSLLTEWDEEKPQGVERTNPLGWDVDEKEELLTYLAVTLFEKNIYFPSQITVVQLISHFLKCRNTEAERILKSLENEHGLLIERVEDYWSFSHLTLQEYFVAKWFTQQEDRFNLLKPYLSEQRWNEVFLLALELSNNPRILKKLKTWTDELVASNENIQNLLDFNYQKSKKVQCHYDSIVVRAYYFNLCAGLECHNLWDWEYIDFTDLPDLLGYDYEDECKILDIDQYFSNLLYIAYSVENHIEYALSLGEYADIVIKQENSDAFMVYIEALDIVVDLAEQLEGFASISESFNLEFLFQFQKLYNKINKQLEAVCRDIKKLSYLKKWWDKNGFYWLERLNNLGLTYLNIGYCYFIETKQDILTLKKYRDANELLVKCLNSLPQVEPEIQKEIEETLLLPIQEIEHWNATIIEP